MLDARHFRELLIADVALSMGLAAAPDVARAVQRYWEKRAMSEASMVEMLVDVAGVEAERLDPAREKVDRLVAAAGGDPELAMTQRGGLAATRSRAGGTLGESGLRTAGKRRYAEFFPAGEGGMGLVYMALDRELSRMVAFKMLRPDAGSASPSGAPDSPLEARRPAAGSPESGSFHDLRARFLQEAWVTGGLEHPGVVPVYEMGETEAGIPYYTMRFVTGQRTLASAIDEVRAAPAAERFKLLEPFVRVCDTVSYAHSHGVIHRDLKPQNIMLGQFGEVMVLDWGLAKVKDGPNIADTVWLQRIQEFRAAEDLATAVGLLGTPGYMAPEAARGMVKQVDELSDVYSLGAILFEILTGHLPHSARRKKMIEYITAVGTQDAPLAHEIKPGTPAELSELCRLALSIDRSVRPSSAEFVAAEIRNWQSSSAKEREAREQLETAERALDAAETANAEERLAEIDSAFAALTQATALTPESDFAASLTERATALRQEALQEREASNIQRARLKTVAWATIVLVVAGAGIGLAMSVPGLLRESEERAAYEDRQDDAQELLDEARAAPQGHPSAILKLVSLRDDPAYADFEKRPEALYLLGQVWEASGNHNHAVAEWVRLYVESPDSAPAQVAVLDMAQRWHDAGRFEASLTAASRLATNALDSQVRNTAMLLAGESALGLGRAGETKWWLDAHENARRAGASHDARRRRRLERAVRAFGQATDLTIPATSPSALATMRVAGRQHLVVQDGEHVQVFPTDEFGAAGEGPRSVIRASSGGSGGMIAVADMDHEADATDELVQVLGEEGWKADHDHGEGWTVLRVLELDGQELRVRFQSAPIPTATYVIGVGDLNHDRRKDIVLGMSWPKRGIHVYLASENESYEQLGEDQLGALLDLHQSDSDIRGISIGDMTGDGRNELVITSSGRGLYGPIVFRHEQPSDGEPGTFVTPFSAEVGFAFECALLDVDGDGSDTCFFSLHQIVDDDLAPLYPDIRRLGVHALRGSPDWAIEPVDTFRRIVLEEIQDPNRRSWNACFHQLKAGRGPIAGPFLVARGSTVFGVEHKREVLRVHTFGDEPTTRNKGGLFLYAEPSRPGRALVALAVADWDGLEGDEILCMWSGVDGASVRVYGTSTELEPIPPDAHQESSPESQEEDYLWMAEHLSEQELHVHAETIYERLEQSDDPAWASRGFFGRVSSVAERRDFDRAITLLEERIAARGPETALRERFRRAQYLERLGRLEEAAVAYRRLATEHALDEAERHDASRRASQLSAWSDSKGDRSQLAFDENWAVTKKGFFRTTGQGGFVVADDRDGRSTLFFPVDVRDRAGIRFTCDVYVETLDIGRELTCGLLDPDCTGTATSQDLAFGISSTTGLKRSVSLFYQHERGRTSSAESPAFYRRLEEGNWYFFELTYDAGSNIARLVVRQRQTGRSISVQELPSAVPPDGTARRLGMRLPVTNHPGRMAIKIDNLEVKLVP